MDSASCPSLHKLMNLRDCLKTDAGAPDRTIPDEPQSPAGSESRWTVFWVCVFLAVITFAVFGQTGSYEFVNFSDSVNIYENTAVTGGLTRKGIAAAFEYNQSGNWIPLTTLSHILDWQLYGPKAGGHHLTNVLLHTASAV